MQYHEYRRDGWCRNMNMREIEIVCELTNFENFSEASFALACSPSVITKYVSNVENELGLKLFIRSNKSSKLQVTPEGAEIIKVMRRISNDYHYMLAVGERLRNQGRSTLCIGTQPRFGNFHESEIISLFLLENPRTEVMVQKDTVCNLANALCAGRIDAIIATFHEDTCVEEYFKEIIPLAELELLHLAVESNMYCGVSEKYFPGRKEVTLRELRDFTFALPFPDTGDTQERNAMRSWRRHAEENGFALKTMNFSDLGDTIFQLAAIKQIAICATHIPAKRDGIKFVRLSDWGGATNLYFVSLMGSRNRALQKMRQVVCKYCDKLKSEQ